MESLFTQAQIEAIARALCDTAGALTGSEIGHLLEQCRIADPDPVATKRWRLHNAFAASQNGRQDRKAILAFIRKALKPERHLGNEERFEQLRASVNRALAFAGLGVDERGKLHTVEQAQTISEAERRANDLRADLVGRGAHPDVLRFCRSELVADNYFHAVLEAVKSIGDKLRARTGLTEDGQDLVSRALGGTPPMLAINPHRTDSEKSEQRGFANLVRGCFGMFRNPTAHEARIHWPIGKEDAEDLLTLASLIHRRIDAASMPPR
jgi:uncharacterized protein (TIGR02391 family)